MKNLKFIITFMFLLGIFLSACGGGGGGGGSSAGNNPEASSSEEITVGKPLDFFKANISPDIIQSKCIDCHVDGNPGTAGTNLQYVSSSGDGHEETNYQILLSYLQSDTGNAEKMLSRVTGNGHGGGKQLDSSSSDYKNLEAFILAVKDLPSTQNNRVVVVDKLEGDLITAGFAGDTEALTKSVLDETNGLEDFVSIIPAAFDGAYDAIQNDSSLDNDQKTAALEVIVESLLSNIDDTTSLRSLRSFSRKAEFTEDFSLLLKNLTRNIVTKVGTSASILQSLTKTVIRVLPATGLNASEIEGTFISLVVETVTDEVMDRNKDSNTRDSLLESLSLGVEEGATLIDKFAINVGNITTTTTELIRDKAKAKDKNYDSSNLVNKIVQKTGVCKLESTLVGKDSSVTAYLSEVATPDSCEEETRICTNGTLSGSYEYSSCSDPETYFANKISPEIIQAKCIACHVSDGPVGNTPLKYVPTTTEAYLATNYQTLVDFINSDSTKAEYLLSKAQGVSHGGGSQLSSNSEEYENLRKFLESIGTGVNPNPTPTGRFWDGITLSDAEQTLRRAALIVSRRLPTEQEIETVKDGDDVALRATLKGLMQGEGFHDFLIQGANDRLHLKAFENGLFLEAADLNATPLFPLGAKKFFEAGDKSEGWPDWMNKWMWGMANSPLELIAYIVENDRSYQEVVTADYMMVNPVMDEILRSATGLNESNSHQEYRRGKNRGQIVPDDQLSSEFIQDFGHRVDSYGAFLDYPHAGILNSHAFLNRYPTTETNRNRARARWTYYHFLGLDIEKSASRTTDPVALADTNNPTMNNPACTVCHQVMDPVAGAYQNYGNAGLFRDSWGGMDALPDTYKHPEWFEENAEPSLYRHGDTWFRDMRTPGINGMYAPNQNNSLQWLGRRIAEDPRFATAAIKFWWPAIMGEEVKTAPESSADVDYQIKLAAFTEQNDFIEELGQQFARGFGGAQPFNAKDLFVEMMMSPWFRSQSTDSTQNTAALTSDLGVRRLLTPEELEAKSNTLLGWKWGNDNSPDLWDYDEEWTQLGNRYNIYYGGIDSNGIKDRSRALTSLMSNVAEKQAVEMACPAVVLDFDRPDGQRLLFDGIDRNTTPASEFGETVSVQGSNFNSSSTFTTSGYLEAGSKLIKIGFLNDWYDEVEGDRNLHVVTIRVKNKNGNTVLYHDSQIPVEGSSTFTCGSTRQNMSLYCRDGRILVPLKIPSAGTYEVEVKAWGDQAGPDPVSMSIGVESGSYEAGTSAGAIALKAKLVEMHQKFLGENLNMSDEELEFSYRLLVETWQDRSTQENNGWAWDWPNENCHFYLESQWQEGGASSRAGDPNHMLYTWTTILIYLMTDFYYLHE